MDAQLTLFGDVEVDEPTVSAAEALQGLRRRLALGLRDLRVGALVLTDNQSTILSSRSDGEGGVDLRLHWSFTEAPEPIVAAAARIVEGVDVRRSRRILRQWADARGDDEMPATLEEITVPAPRRAAAALDPVGRVHDLLTIRDEVNERYFGGRHRVVIGWSRSVRPGRRRRAQRRTIQLGSWSADDRRVLVHPVLDHASVPRWLVAAVVHHELLHADLDPVVSNGRRRVHTPEFRLREREFEHHEAARQWLDRHLDSLFRRRARSRPARG